MTILNIFWRPEATRIHKGSVLLNVFAAGYFILLTTITVLLTLFVIQPHLYKNDSTAQFVHFVLMVFIVINIAGNFLLVMLTDSSTARLDLDKIRRNEAEEVLSMFKLCTRCNLPFPPEAHHCPLCDVCILRRDHHCFFMCVCIGYHNQKYFILWCLYMILGTMYCMPIIAMYLKAKFNITFQPWTIFSILPASVYGWWFTEDVNGFQVFIAGIFLACLATCVASVAYLTFQVIALAHGQTTFSLMRNSNAPKPKPFLQNCLEMFGPYWFISVFLPLPLPQYNDGIPKIDLKRKVN